MRVCRKNRVLCAVAFAVFACMVCACSKEEEPNSARAPQPQPVKADVPIESRLEELCRAGDFRGAEKLLKSVKEGKSLKGLSQKIRGAVSESFEDSLDSCSFKTALDAASLLSFLTPSGRDREAILEKISRKYHELYKDGRFGKVIELYNLAVPQFLAESDADTTMQAACASLGETKKSLELAEKIFKSNPGSPAALEAYINAIIASGEPQRALSEIRGSFLSKDKYNASYHQLAARAAAAMGDIEAASGEYLQAAYYSRGNISILVECGQFFVEHSRKSDFERIIAPASRISQDSPIETVVGYGYLQALGLSKGSGRNFDLLSNVIEYAPLFIDAHFLYADWLMESGLKDDAAHAIGILQGLSLRLKEKNDAVMVKILEISSTDSSFTEISKEILRKLEKRFSEPGCGSLEDRKRFLELLQSLSKKDWDLAKECERIRVKISEVKLL